jgi:hypothetical protein
LFLILILRNLLTNRNKREGEEGGEGDENESTGVSAK